MRFLQEIIYDHNLVEAWRFSASAIDAKPFSDARIKQGGYGFHGKSFWLQRIRNRKFHVFVYTVSGEGIITLEDGTELHQKRGDFFISWSRGQGHAERTISDEPWEMLWLTIWEDSPLFKVSDKDWEMRNCIEFIDNMTVLAKNITKEERTTYDRGYEAMILYERLFLLDFERSLSLSEKPKYGTHRAKLEILWDKVVSQLYNDWSISRLSEEAGYSRSHFIRLCQEIYGKNPGEIVKEMRMLQAQVILRNSTTSIEKLAERVGYQNISTFSTAFKDYSGMCPREYRKKHSSIK